MKTFKRHISQAEIRALCGKRGWLIDTANYDNGSDWITFRWRYKMVERDVMYCSFNGRFMCKEADEIYSGASADDCTPWFGALLRTLYRQTALKKS